VTSRELPLNAQALGHAGLNQCSGRDPSITNVELKPDRNTTGAGFLVSLRPSGYKTARRRPGGEPNAPALHRDRAPYR
jgi:hypothetical protein